MRVKMILPALTEATSPFFRPIKYSLFPPLGLATLAAYGYDGARRLLTPLVAVMFLATLWFLYLQAFVIRAFCTYCLISAAVTTTLALLVLARRLLGSGRKLA